MKRLLSLLFALAFMVQPGWAAQNAVAIPTSGPLPGLTMINDVNAALNTVETVNSGTTAPTAVGLGLSSLAGVVWHDTTTNTLKIRDLADANWITLFQIDETSKVAVAVETVLASASAQTVGGANHYASFVGTAAAAYTLAATSSLTNGFGFSVFAQGGAITVSINASDKINGGTTGAGIVVPVGMAASFVTDGAGNWWVNISPAVLGTGSLASAATTDLGSIGATAITVTGTTPITSFGASAQAGVLKVVTFSGALTLTYNSTSLITPTNASITTAAGDSLMALALGSGNWRVVSYTKADGTALASTVSSLDVPVRQTVLAGDVDANNKAAFLTVGTGLTPAFTVASGQLVMTWANGHGVNGASDLVTRLTTAGSLSAIPASSASYLYAAYVSPTSVTWGSRLVPPQYGQTYDNFGQFSLSLNNNISDDFGHTWANTSVTFNNASPAIAGTYYGVFNGAAIMKSTELLSFGTGPWFMRGWFNLTTLSAEQRLMGAVNGSNWGAAVEVNTSGHTVLYLSSTGTSYDIANGTVGTATVTPNTWHYYELTRDTVSGKYYLYVDGVADQAITSAANPSVFTGLVVGGFTGGSIFLTGHAQGIEAGLYCSHPGGTAYAAPTALPGTASGADWFDTSVMQMKTPSGAGPTFTPVQRLYVGEAVAGASTIASVVSYALQGAYVAPWTPTVPAAGTTISFTHNLGTDQFNLHGELRNLAENTGNSAIPIGATIPWVMNTNSSVMPAEAAFTHGRNTAVGVNGNNQSIIYQAAAGSWSAGTSANWEYRATFKRSF